MENIKVKKAPKRLKAWADNFVFWAPCPYFVAFGIIYQLED